MACRHLRFLDLKKNHGKEEQRARDLFYALWIPDLFMKRVEENGDWTLMCPNECPGFRIRMVRNLKIIQEVRIRRKRKKDHQSTGVMV